jgi:hypothetical protein
MKSLLKKVFIFLLFVALLILIPKIFVANAQTPAPSCSNSQGPNPCPRTITGNTLDTMCVKFKTTVNVINLPAGKNVYLSCDGDYGEGYVRNKQPSTTATDASIQCGGTYCNGGYGGCAGQNWCEGEITTAITGSTGPVSQTSQAIDLNHCSCKQALPNPDGTKSPNLGCLQVSVSSSPPTMANACDNSHNPTVVGGLTKDIPVDCSVSINDAPACYINGGPAHSDIVTVKCPTPKTDVPVKVYVDNDNNNVLNKSVDTLYTSNISVTEGSSAFTGTGTTTIPGLDIGSNITATLANITGYNIITNPPLANPVTNYTVLSSGNEIDFLIQAPRCVPATCSSTQVCGDIPSGCTGVPPIHCGDCTNPNTCSNNACTCTPKTHCDTGQVCGLIPDGCGGQVQCVPGCDAATGQTCNNNACSCPTGQSPTHLACGTDHTCQVVNTCGIDSCTAGQNCGPATTLSFVIGLDGIGTTGDQLNPGWTQLAGQPLSGSTLSPVHTTRPVTVYLTDSSQHTQQFQGAADNIVYDPVTTDQNYGKFATLTPIDLGTHIQAGTYTVYVTVDSHLTKSLGTVTIALGQDNPVSGGKNAGNLVAGDIVGVGSNTADNKLTIEDYNVLISCTSYSVDHSLCNSNTTFPGLSDLDDNGDGTAARGPLVNQFDYNLWLREYSSTPNGDTPPNITTSASAQTQASPALTIVSVVETSTSSAATTIQQPATGTQTGTSSSPAAATTIQQPATDTQTGTTNATASGQ